MASFHILHEPSIKEQLRTELNAAIPDQLGIPALTRLETLPYLNACVEEGKLRPKLAALEMG